MILVHFKDGTNAKLFPSDQSDLCALDDPNTQRKIRRVAILDGNGHRVDLPAVRNGSSRIWAELLKNSNDIRGERICMRYGKQVLRVTLYYSDGRVVVDL